MTASSTFSASQTQIKDSCHDGYSASSGTSGDSRMPFAALRCEPPPEEPRLRFVICEDSECVAFVYLRPPH